MDKQEMRETFNTLLEAWRDQRAARGELRDFEASNPPLQPPRAFQSLQEFLEYHEDRQDYEDRLTHFNDRIIAARAQYAAAASKIRKILPERVPLRYTYQGGREELEDTECTILNAQGHVRITDYQPQPEPKEV
jgi:hypothetical protein